MEIRDTESSEDEVKGMAHSTARRTLISLKTSDGQKKGKIDVAKSPPQPAALPGYTLHTPSPRQKVFSPRTMQQITVAKTSTEIATMAAEWLMGIDRRRVKSKNLHGRLSGEMKQRIEYLYDAIHILADRSEAAGDVDFLKKNNSELKARLRASEREEVRMREDLDDCEGRIKGLKKEISVLKDRVGYRSPSLGAGKVGRAEREIEATRVR